MPLPPYLFHATSKENAATIAADGLEPRSGTEDDKYLCMSGSERGAVTLQSKASDIIFRVSAASLNRDSWKRKGAGNQEWRSSDGISNNNLEYRRNLGTPSQRMWRAADQYPQGM